METAMASLDRSCFFSPSSSSPSSSSSSAPSSNSLINTLLPPSFCASELELSLLCRKRPNAHPFCAFRYISASHHIKRISSFASKSCIHGKYGSRKENGSISQSLFLIDLLNALSTTVSPESKRFSCHSSADDSSFSIGKEETEASAQLIGAGAGVFGKETQSLWLETAEDRKGSGDFLQRDNISKNEYGERDQLYGVGEEFVAVEREEDVVQSDFKVEVERKSNESSSSLDTGILLKEPIYEVLEVKPSGAVFTKSISRRQLLKSSGLRLRDIRSVDPSLWITNSVPALLVRDQAILLNLGSLRAIGTPENVLIFDHKSIGAAAFLELLLQRLKPESNPGVPTMPFELEVVESALLSRTQRLERRLMEIEPRVLTLLEVLPNRLTANFLEELRLSKQGLVELGSKSGALRQMLLELLESPQEIRRMTIMGRRCTIKKDDGSIECVFPSDKHSADDEEEEIEMLLENYLQRCESCHGQAERLLDSAKEMEDSIAVNLSSRRLEVSRLELLLQVGTFCSALGALFAGIFGMNLKSYLETSTFAFWITTGGIIFGGIILFFIMYNHLKRRKIL